MLLNRAQVSRGFTGFQNIQKRNHVTVFESVCSGLSQCKTKGHPTKKDSVWLDCALMSCQTGRPLLPFPWMSLTPPSSPSLASSQNHEYRFDISTSVSRCIFGNLKFSHHKSSKLLMEDSDSHVVPLTPHFLMIFRQQFGKVASFCI